MRVMVLVKATKDSEAGAMPSTELLEAMGKYNEELVNAGIMLAGEGLKPSAQGKRIAFAPTMGALAEPHVPSCTCHGSVDPGVAPETLTVTLVVLPAVVPEAVPVIPDPPTALIVPP